MNELVENREAAAPQSATVDSAIARQILGLVAEVVPRVFKKVELTRTTHLKRDLGLDSISLMMLVFRFEEVFGVDVGRLAEQVPLAELRTVGDVLDASLQVLPESSAGGG